MTARIPIIGTIGLINASVFYVVVRVFSQGDVITYTDGRMSVASDLLMLKMGALGGFLLVSMIGLYVTLQLLSESDPNDRLKRDKERYLSWKLEYKNRQSPRPVTQSKKEREHKTTTNENEQIPIDNED